MVPSISAAHTVQRPASFYKLYVITSAPTAIVKLKAWLRFNRWKHVTRGASVLDRHIPGAGRMSGKSTQHHIQTPKAVG